MVYRDVGEWLSRRYGLNRGYLLGTFAAEQENVLMAEFFVPMEGYERLQDLRSRILFAPEGYGKSALRIMGAAYLAANTAILGVEYTDFEHFTQHRKPTLRQQIEHLLYLAVKRLVAYLCALVSNSGAHVRLSPLSAAQNARLAAFIYAYAADLCSARHLYPIFQMMSSTIALSWSDFEAYVNGKTLGVLVDGNQQLAANPIAHFWAEMVAQPFIALDRQGSPTEMLKIFAEFTKDLGLTGLHFLVDGLGQSGWLCRDPVAQIDFLESLFTTTGLLDMEGVSFGFFLTTSAWQELQNRPAFQSNQIEAVEVRWSDQALRELLRRRLFVYSDGKLHDFSLLCRAQDRYVRASASGVLQRLPEFLETCLIEKANGSPRRLLKLINALLDIHFHRYSHEPLILEQGLDEQDWQLIQPYIATILGEDAP